MSQAAIGIDVGGTKVSVTLGTEVGKILARKEFPTPLRAKSKQALIQINAIVLVPNIVVEARLRKFGVAAGCANIAHFASARNG